MRLFGVVWCILLLAGSFCNAVEIASSSDVIAIKKIDGPVLDGKVNAQEWEDAALLEFNFTFANGQSYRAKVYLGHNATHFFVGAILFNVGPNPSTVPDYVVRPDGFYIYFDVDNDGELTTPEDAKGLLNFIGVYQSQVFWSQSISKDGFWDSTEYPPFVRFWHARRPEVEGKIFWTPDENAWMAHGKLHDITTHGSGSYNASFGDQHFEFYFSLNSNDTLTDGLHLKTGEAITMGFALEYYRQGYELENGTVIPDLYDFWPGEGFTPNVLINASAYAKMSIDLRTIRNDFPDLRTLFFIITIIALSIILVVSFQVKSKKQHLSDPKNFKNLYTNK